MGLTPLKQPWADLISCLFSVHNGVLLTNPLTKKILRHPFLAFTSSTSLCR